MRWNSLIVCVFLLCFCGPVLGGEVIGQVELDQSSLKERAENSNPNRKVSVKKYGLKDLRRAQAGGKGGPPPNEEVDERDYVIVFITQQADGAKLKATTDTVLLRQADRRFFDHVTPVVLGSQVRFTNEDRFFHHIYCPDSSSLNVPEHRGSVTRKPDKLGKYELFCDIHPLMNAYVYVVPNDKFSQTRDGAFTIKDVPAGNYVVQAWHPRSSSQAKKIKVTESEPTVVNFKL